jgi:hypothetical protein
LLGYTGFRPLCELEKYEIPKAADSEGRILMQQLVTHPSFGSELEWLKTLTSGRHMQVAQSSKPANDNF